VLDLACLEGQYAVEFALHGAEVLGIEGRPASVAKCEYVKASLDLRQCTFICDDVRNISRERYGAFDIVICSGILYHLPAADALKFLKGIYSMNDNVLLIDTFISLFGRTAIDVNGRSVRGHYYFEHAEADDELAKRKRSWASLDNPESFWFTQPSLINTLTDVGYCSVLDALTPTMPNIPCDRKTYVAIKGERCQIRSSEPTDGEPLPEVPEIPTHQMDDSQRPGNIFFRAAKRYLPQPIKDAIKPPLRVLGLLPKDRTPDFMKRQPS
jgi:hypothetical protein